MPIKYIESNIEGHIETQEPRMEYMKQIMIDMMKKSYELKEMINDRDA